MNMRPIPALGGPMLKRPLNLFNGLMLLFSKIIIIIFFSSSLHHHFHLGFYKYIVDLCLQMKQKYLRRVAWREYPFHTPSGFYQQMFPGLLTDCFVLGLEYQRGTQVIQSIHIFDPEHSIPYKLCNLVCDTFDNLYHF